MKPIVNFYGQFVTDLEVTIDDDGTLYTRGRKADTWRHIRVSINDDQGKRSSRHVYLPTDENLNRDEDGTRVLFHPACESPLRGNSEIINKIILLMTHRLHSSIVMTVDALLRVASDTDSHASLPLGLMELVSKLPAVSKGTVNHWAKLISQYTPTGRHPVISIALTRDNTHAGIKYSRSCEIITPFLESEGLLEVKSKIGHMCIVKAFELVAGTGAVKHSSNSPTAPSFIALAKSFHEIMSHVSSVDACLGKYRKLDINYSGKWVKDLDKLHDWYNDELYVQLIGNIGVGDIGQSNSSPASGESSLVTGREIILDEPDDDDEPVAVSKKPAATDKNGIPAFIPPQNRPGSLQQPMQQPVQMQYPPQQYVNNAPAMQRQGYAPPPGQETYYDPRTGKYRPRTGSTDPVLAQQQPYQNNAPINYPEVMGWSGPITDVNGNVFYNNNNTGVSSPAAVVMQGLVQRNSGGMPQQQQPNRITGYDAYGRPVYG